MLARRLGAWSSIVFPLRSDGVVPATIIATTTSCACAWHVGARMRSRQEQQPPERTMRALAQWRLRALGDQHPPQLGQIIQPIFGLIAMEMAIRHAEHAWSPLALNLGRWRHGAAAAAARRAGRTLGGACSDSPARRTRLAVAGRPAAQIGEHESTSGRLLLLCSVSAARSEVERWMM